MKYAYTFRQMASVFHTGIYCLKDGQLTSFEENPEYNPLYCGEQLREQLQRAADAQTAPVVLRDDFSVLYICTKHEDAYYFMGPLPMLVMSRRESHRFFRSYGIDEKWEKNLRYHPLMEILQMTGMLANLLTGIEYTDQQLVDANYNAVSRATEERDRIQFDIKSEEEDIFRHSYQEEYRILEAVKTGNVDDAVHLSKSMDANIGRLGETEVEHWRNVCIVSATLCARAAIEAGVRPSEAYRVSGFYINECTACEDVTQILVYRNHAVEELVKCVREKNERRTSGVVEQCKEYVYAHYRDKIYLDEIAEALGISSSYLSRLFKQETGTTIQDFINDVRIERAANLLIYSNETLATIAEYVNFPSQSYFGKIFKQKLHMTPKRYREQYKLAEFYDRKD